MGWFDRLSEYLKVEIEEPKKELPVAKIDSRDLFEKAIEFVLKEEGGYADNARDPGGETKFGISKRSYPHLDIRNLRLEDAKEIYRRDYWLPTGDKVKDIDPYLAVVLFDTAVNMGVPTAIRLLQRAVNTKEDGRLGPLTIQSTRENKDNAIERLLLQRMRRYSELPTWETFKNGWMARMIRLSLSNSKYTGDNTV